MRPLVADVKADADQPASCVEIANHREDAVAPAIAEAADAGAGEVELTGLQFRAADLRVEFFEIAVRPVVYAGVELL